MPSWRYVVPGILILAAVLGILLSCAAKQPAPLAQRLVDDFSPALVSGTRAGAGPKPMIWRGDAPGWEVVAGIRDLSVKDGRLTGETTTAAPVLRLASIPGVDPGDLVHEVQVRMRVSSGKGCGVHFVPDTPNGLDRTILEGAEIPWPHESPVIPGAAIETFVVRPLFPVTGASVSELLIKPADEAGARFEIESVRLIFRREYLMTSIPSGIGWHGLGEAYRESVVARSPESVRWEVQVPDRPRLTLSLATLDERPVTFRISVRSGNGQPVELLRRTVSTPHSWDPASVDLDAWSGRKATLTLSLEADQAGALGFWGAPAIRRRGPLPEGKGGEPRPQGVGFILVDTLRADRLDAYGHRRPTAPTLARLAREGGLFRNAMSQATWTKVSVPSLLTSLYPLTNGVRDFPDRLPSSATTLAEVYRNAGYATAAFNSTTFVGNHTNLHQGYEELYERSFGTSGSKTARAITNQFLPWLEEHRDEPFFAFLHYLDPHSPYEPDPPYDRLWHDGIPWEEHEQRRKAVVPFIQDPLRRQAGYATPAEFRTAKIDPVSFMRRELAAYDGSIRQVDTELKRLLERFSELGLDRRTLIVLTSDHGEEFHEHGSMFHGQSLYDELARVPLVVRYPEAVPAGIRVEEPVALLDVMPTLLELSGLELPAGMQGRSVLPLLQEKGKTGARPRPIFIDRPPATHFASPHPKELGAYAVIHEGWKLVWNFERPEGFDRPEFELYDFRRDPGDRRNVAARHPEVVGELSKLLRSWEKDAKARRIPSGEEETRGMSPEEQARLRALGYIQ